MPGGDGQLGRADVITGGRLRVSRASTLGTGARDHPPCPRQRIRRLTEVLMTAGHEPVYSVTPLAERQATLDELFRGKMAQPIRSADDLACDGIFEPDEELEEFPAYTSAARRADLA